MKEGTMKQHKFLIRRSRGILGEYLGRKKRTPERCQMAAKFQERLWIQREEEVEITPEKIKKILKKMPNWKVPGPHFGEGFWLKNFKIFKKDLKKTCKNA